MNDERLNPIKITDKKTGNVYELDFSREAVYTAENNGFKIDEVGDFPTVNIPILFYYAFRKNHRRLSKAQTDKILTDVLHGVTPEILTRLIGLYHQARFSNNIQDEEDLEKNEFVTVEM